MKIKSLTITMLALMMPSLGFSAIGDIFTARSEEGVVMTFCILSETKKEVKVGGKSNGKAVNTKLEGAVTVPDEVLGYTVVEIGQRAFSSCSEITEVVLHTKHLREIGSRAFLGCTSLEKIEIPDGVTVVQENTFCNCKNLRTVILPNSVVYIDENAFQNCKNLMNVTFGSGLRDIGEYAFEGCNSLSTLFIPGNVIRLLKGAFYDCLDLITVTISDGVRTIGNFAFAKNSNLEEISMGATVDSIGARILYGCSSLKKIIVNNPLPIAIAETAFSATNSEKIDYTIYDNVILSVPIGSKSLYENALVWSLFKNIEEHVPSTINSTVTDTYSPVEYFSLDGKRQIGIQKGMNVLKDRTGKTHKILKN